MRRKFCIPERDYQYKYDRSKHVKIVVFDSSPPMDSISLQIEREPKRVHTVRRYAYWLVPFFYLAYILYLINNLVTDTYILKTDHNFLKEITVPGLYLY